MLLVLGLAGPATASEGARESLILKDGDRVIFLGSAVIEHEQDHGFLETRLTQRFPDASITFRNFGWSGDTVSGTARTGGFQNPDGFARLLKEVRAFKPTVIFIGYGMNESFSGSQGLPGFIKGFTVLLDQLAPLKARTVILSPTSHEDLGLPFPEPGAHNRELKLYAAALAKVAAERNLWFVDLYHAFAYRSEVDAKRPLTTNGLLPNESGYWLIAHLIEQKLFGARGNWNIEVDRSSETLKSFGAKVEKGSARGDGVSLEIKPKFLPLPALMDLTRGPRLRVFGLTPGSYALRMNGRDLRAATAAEWEQGVTLSPDPALAQTDKLRAAIVKKSQLFYRRWRPFNDHDRHWGFIGGDFKLYDMEIAAQERVIAELRRPAVLRFEIVKNVKGK